MLAAYSYCVLFLSLSLLLLQESDTQEVTPRINDWDEEVLYDLEKIMYFDMLNKYESVAYVKSRYKRKSSFFMGQMAFQVRTKHAQQMHMVHRCQKDNRTIEQLSKNATSCQRIFYAVHTAIEALQSYLKKNRLEDLPDDIAMKIQDTLENNTVDETTTIAPIIKSTNAITTKDTDSSSTIEDTTLITTTEDTNYDDDNEYRRSRNAYKSYYKPRQQNARNVRKSLKFLGMADHTLRIEQFVKNLRKL